MKQKGIKISVILLALIAVIYSCRKAVSEEQQRRVDETVFYRNESLKPVFSSLNNGYATDANLDFVIKKYKELDNIERFSGELKDKFGLPLWDIAIALKNENGLRTIVVPLEKKYEGKEALLFAYFDTENDVRFKLVDNKRPHKLLPRHTDVEGKTFTIDALNWLFETARNNKQKYANTIGNSKNPENATIVNGVYVEWECWWSYGWTEDGGFWTTNTNCRYTIRFTGTSTKTMDANDDVGGGGGGGGGGGTSGGGYMTKKDSIINLLQGYPCAQSLLNEIVDCDDVTKQVLKDVFGVDVAPSIKFISNSNLPDSIAGQAGSENGSLANYMALIELNPKYLNGSKDYIAATIIHESIHAYIRYMRITLDTTEFKTLFPIYWQFKKDNADHNEMANRYINSMSSLLKRLNNNLPDSIANALSWGGLHQTGIWNTIDSAKRNQILIINSISKNPTVSQADSLKLKKCTD